MIYPSRTVSSERGYALLSVIAVIASLLVGAAATIGLTRTELWHTAQQVGHQRAFYIAEAGIQRAIAQLDLDKVTASASTGYSWSASGQNFGGGTFDVAIGQDSLYPSNPQRKAIIATGTLGNQQSQVKSRVVVQTQDAFSPGKECPILFSDTGRARLVNNAALISTLFNGEIFSNDDVEFSMLVGALPNAQGTVRARGNFIESLVLNLGLSSLNANLHRQGNFIHSTPPFHIHGLTGIRFSNGSTGVQQAISARTFPVPDYQKIRQDPRTIVVNSDNVPFGSWHSASGTWVASAFQIPASGDVIYYVEGNASLAGITLLRQSRGTIVTRGWLVLNGLSLVTTDLFNGLSDIQRLTLIGEGNVYVGRQLSSFLPFVIQSENSALSDALSGLGLAAVEALDRNQIYAYSETGEAWVKGGTVNAASQTRACIVAKQNATLAFTASALSTVREVGT